MKTMVRWGGCLLAMALLAGCGTPAPTISPVSPLNSVVATPARDDASVGGGRPTPTVAVNPEQPVSSGGGVGEQLLSRVAQKLGVAATELTVVSAEEVEWSDASLGCPEPGMFYAQVITPGWRVIYKDAGGKEIDIRTNGALSFFVICTTGADGAPVPAADKAVEAVKEAALQAAATWSGIEAKQLTVDQVEPVQWPDSCMGCARPDQACMELVMPGYRVLVRSGDMVIEVHSDATGRLVQVCEEGGR